MKNLVLLLFILFNYTIAQSQTPGNVGTANLTAWFKATDLSNGNVTSWTTAYPTGASAITVTDAAAPYPVATNTPGGNISNYNTTIYFDTTNLVANIGVNLRGLASNASLNLLDNRYSGDQGTFFGNYYFPKFYDNNDHMMEYNESGTYYDGIQFRNLGVNGRFAIGHLSSNSSNANRNWSENNLPTTIAYKGNRGTSSTMSHYENSLLNPTNSVSQCSGPTGLRFGYKSGNNSSQFKGFLNEFIFFNRDLTTNEMIRIETYLAVKYGITLDNSGGGTQGDYLSTTSVTLWDASANSGYHNNVIGIGRDDNEGLLQKQSHSFKDTTRLYINTLAASNVANGGSFGSDVSYVMIGDNQGRMCNTATSIAEIPGTCGLFARMEREWKITKTNFAASFNIDLKLNTCGAPGSVVVSELKFLVDDDGDFSNGGTTCYFNGDGSGIVFSYANPVITISNISGAMLANNTTNYITIGSTQSTTPLPMEMASIKANCTDYKTLLSWVTSSETNNNFFTIDRSENGFNFESIALIDGAGNSTSTLFYSWTDENPIRGTSYYRLSQTDFDGQSESFTTQSADCRQNQTINVYPNPFSKSLVLDLSSLTTFPISISIMDGLGRVIYSEVITEKTSRQELQIANSLLPGTYFLNIRNRHQDLNKKIIKSTH